MSLRRRGQHYFLDLRVAGKRYRRALHTSLKSEAPEKYDEERAKILAMHGQGQPRFEDVIQAYIEWAKSSHPASAGREEQRLGKIKAWLVSKDIVHLSEFTPLQAEQLRGHLRDQGLSRATINRYAQILRGLFYRAKDWGFFRGDNPLRKIRFYREDRALRPLTDKEIKKILAAARELGRKVRSWTWAQSGHIDKTLSPVYRIYRWWENEMKKIIGIGLLIFLAASCTSIFSPDQKIIMIDGPGILWPTDEYFYIGGHVQNISDQTIRYIEISICLRDSMGFLLASRKTQPDEEILAPGQTSYWSILFYDPDQLTRNRMDLSKLTYKISY